MGVVAAVDGHAHLGTRGGRLPMAGAQGGTMKTKTLTVVAGLSAPLILCAPTSGGFLGLKVESKPNEFGLLVCNVYAEFDRPKEDFMIAVAGTPNNQLTIEVVGGEFYQNDFGTDQRRMPS